MYEVYINTINQSCDELVCLGQREGLQEISICHTVSDECKLFKTIVDVLYSLIAPEKCIMLK